ncbi:hypothetical protein RB653_008767 [Dictyostelium firmibasis]|uniref:Uncharacterized protein n=1 Tax=Dictyostelium firmibasis TaxID=79012 RepID=A0AAN7U145_9MYCE
MVYKSDSNNNNILKNFKRTFVEQPNGMNSQFNHSDINKNENLNNSNSPTKRKIPEIYPHHQHQHQHPIIHQQPQQKQNSQLYQVNNKEFENEMGMDIDNEKEYYEQIKDLKIGIKRFKSLDSTSFNPFFESNEQSQFLKTTNINYKKINKSDQTIEQQQQQQQKQKQKQKQQDIIKYMEFLSDIEQLNSDLRESKDNLENISVELVLLETRVKGILGLNTLRIIQTEQQFKNKK